MTEARGPLRCGACTLCCTVMKVTMPAEVKPAHQTCRHCSEKGCAIYAVRPEICAVFQCFWLGSQSVPGWALDPALRPDRCGVVVDMNSAGTIIAHCHRPASWKREPIHAWLLAMAARTNVMLELGGATALLRADGSTVALTCIGVDPTTNNRLYVHEAAQ